MTGAISVEIEKGKRERFPNRVKMQCDEKKTKEVCEMMVWSD